MKIDMSCGIEKPMPKQEIIRVLDGTDKPLTKVNFVADLSI